MIRHSKRDLRGCFKDGGNKSVKRLNVGLEKTLHKDPTVALKHRNFLKFLNNRELGVTSCVQAEKEFYQIKTSHKTKESSLNLSLPCSYDSCEVDMIKGDDKSLFGVWRMNSGSEKENYILGQISYEMNDDGYVPQKYLPSAYVIDMCRIGSTNDLIMVRNCTETSLIVFDIRIENPPPMHCCCFIPGGDDTVMFGCDEHLLTISRGRHFHIYETYARDVCTLLHHEPSKVTLVGLHTGEILLLDHRVEENTYSIKVSDDAINDAVFLNDQEVIVTDVEGKLVKVDLRTNDISAYFFGHKHSATKRPFSVANNMLCATGIDNVVRIWHVSGGHPIHVHKSNSIHEVRGWLNCDANKTYLNYFERDTKTVFTI